MRTFGMSLCAFLLAAHATMQASEKTYLSFQLEVKNPGGYSSLPDRNNAIYHLAAGWNRLAGFEFPVKLGEVTRQFFQRMSSIVTGQLAADMKGVLRTPPQAAGDRTSVAIALYNTLLRAT